MIVGVLKEIKPQENRVCMTPAGVDLMVANGHTVYVEKNAGIGSGFDDSLYIQAGAEILDRPEQVYEKADLVMHVKEPQPSEFDMIRKSQVVFTYLHLAADLELTKALLKTGSVGIAYETIQDRHGGLPLLAPMSEVAGARAPKLITRDMLPTMKKGAVIVDVAIDQGGCFETSRPTTHKDPIYEVDGIIHYCVANMPGAVPLTSAIALTNVTLPYALKIANHGWKELCRQDPGFASGVNYVADHLVCRPVAEAFDLPFTRLESIINTQITAERPMLDTTDMEEERCHG